VQDFQREVLEARQRQFLTDQYRLNRELDFRKHKFKTSEQTRRDAIAESAKLLEWLRTNYDKTLETDQNPIPIPKVPSPLIVNPTEHPATGVGYEWENRDFVDPANGTNGTPFDPNNPQGVQTRKSQHHDLIHNQQIQRLMGGE